MTNLCSLYLFLYESQSTARVAELWLGWLWYGAGHDFEAWADNSSIRRQFDRRVEQ